MSEKKLTVKQELFCKLFASDKEFFGNGVKSYIEAYGLNEHDKKDYSIAKSGAYENLNKPHILERINELFESEGLNDTFVDKQLLKLITQDADFAAKNKAITEYNKLKQRITEKKDITSGGEPLGVVVLPTLDQLDEDTLET